MLSISIFQELLKRLLRATFDKLIRFRQGGKYFKDFSDWDYLIAMLYAQLS